MANFQLDYTGVQINELLGKADTAIQSIPSEYVTDTELQAYHDDTKQNIISDLSTIRTNAQAGKTANDTIATYGDIVTHNASEYQIAGDYATNTDLTTGLATKQNTITDLVTIRNNAKTGSDLAPQVAMNTQRIEDLTTARIPDVIYHGTPKITGGQVSDFSNVNYLQFPLTDISRGLPFDIYFSFTTSNDVTTQQNIIDSYFGLALAIQNSKGIMALSSNGTTWDIGQATGTNTLLPNTTYYVKYSWTGTEYNASLSTNEQSYVPDMILTSSLKPHATTMYIGGSPDLFGAGTSHPFKGIINFTKSKVVVNEIIVWEGLADVGIASRANVSLTNLDDAGEFRFNSKQDVINDLATIRSGAELGATALQSVPEEYVKNTDYATQLKGGVFKVSDSYATAMNTSGFMVGRIFTPQQYTSIGNYAFVSKGTYENVRLDKSVEEWQFTLADGSTVTKKVVLGE